MTDQGEAEGVAKGCCRMLTTFPKWPHVMRAYLSSLHPFQGMPFSTMPSSNLSRSYTDGPVQRRHVILDNDCCGLCFKKQSTPVAVCCNCNECADIFRMRPVAGHDEQRKTCVWFIPNKVCAMHHRQRILLATAAQKYHDVVAAAVQAASACCECCQRQQCTQ